MVSNLLYIYKVVISVCLGVYRFVGPIVTEESIDGFASNVELVGNSGETQEFSELGFEFL